MASLRRLLWALPFPMALVVLWHLAVSLQWLTLIPTPLKVGVSIWDFTFGGVTDTVYSASFPVHLQASAERVIIGFGLATLTAVPLGILLGRSRTLSGLVEPTLELLRPVPVTAWLPLVLILFGLGTQSAVALIFIGAFYPVLLNTIHGVKSVSPRLVEAANMLGTDGPRLLYKIILPAALPSIFGGLRIGLGFAWVVVVVGEMTGVQTGLGSVIMEARTLSKTDLVITGMVFIGLAGYLTDRAMTQVIRLALHNRPMMQA